jgi:hypothetical protein
MYDAHTLKSEILHKIEHIKTRKIKQDASVLTHLTEHDRWNKRGCGQEDSLEESSCIK